MAKQPKPKPKGELNAARRNGKAPKKNPKGNVIATGKTVGGFTPLALQRRAEKRAKMFAGLKGE